VIRGKKCAKPVKTNKFCCWITQYKVTEYFAKNINVCSIYSVMTLTLYDIEKSGKVAFVAVMYAKDRQSC
jgi:hypothetical protein